MENSVEITKEAFDALCPLELDPCGYEGLEHAAKLYFFVKGVKLLSIKNYISDITQYYIQDING